MFDISSRVALIELKALLAADVEIDLVAGRRLVLRITGGIANRERALLYADYLEGVLLSYAQAAQRTDFQIARQIGNRLLQAIEAASELR